MTRALISGCAGFMGSVLTPMLLAAGYDVTGYDILRFGIKPIEPLLKNPHFRLMVSDIRDPYQLSKALEDADIIIHLAGIVGAPAVAADPETAYTTNVEGTRLINDLRSPEQLFMFASSGSVYGRVESGLCTEETIPNPQSDYGKQKYSSEQEILDKGNAIIYRFATLFGTSPRMRLDLLPNDLINKALNEGYVELYEPAAWRTFCHVIDVGRSWLHAITQREQMLNRVYNMGDESMNLTKLSLAELIQEYVDYDIQYGQGKDPDSRYYFVDYSKLRATGFETTIDMRQGIEMTIDDLKRAQSL